MSIQNNQGGSGVNLEKINSDLKNVNESIEIEVRVGDQQILPHGTIVNTEQTENTIMTRAKPPRDRKRLKSASHLGRGPGAVKRESSQQAIKGIGN